MLVYNLAAAQEVEGIAVREGKASSPPRIRTLGSSLNPKSSAYQDVIDNTSILWKSLNVKAKADNS